MNTPSPDVLVALAVSVIMLIAIKVITKRDERNGKY